MKRSRNTGHVDAFMERGVQEIIKEEDQRCLEMLDAAACKCVEKQEMVDHPAHYGGADNPYEAIKVIEAWGLDFCLGNCVKYIARAGKKKLSNELEDIRKAVWYLNRRIGQIEKTMCENFTCENYTDITKG